MKERILKLCKRLDKFSFDEISLIADDVNKSVLELILLTLESEKYLKREGSYYIYLRKKTVKKQHSKLPLFFQFHKQEDINYMIKGFCSDIEANKMRNLFDLSKHVVNNFNQYFRIVIYEKQMNELLKHFAKKPKMPQERIYMNTLVYLYLYNHKLYVSEKYLQHRDAVKHTESERLEIKNIYLRSYRKVLSRSFEHKFHLHLAEELWKYGKDFSEQKTLMNKMLFS